jgi:hypothetical protein
MYIYAQQARSKPILKLAQYIQKIIKNGVIWCRPTLRKEMRCVEAMPLEKI